ncbi:MAG: tetratricopeptide repeat protein [Thermodesulfovibrionales bacterium]|nr:tetratricopeptide repeat protein [Thermodesulfovibrionales bacterium]
MPRVIKKRVEKKAAGEKELKDTVGDIKEKLKQRQRILTYAAGIFIVLVTLVIGFSVYFTTNKSKALESELEGYRLYHGEYEAKAISPSDRYKKSLEMFNKAYSYKKKPYLLLYMANCNYELGNYDEAIKTLQRLNSQSSSPQLISLSYYKMATAYLKKDKKDDAVKALNNLYAVKDSPLKDIALMEMGKILESEGKPGEAKNKYKELMEKFPKSVLVNEAKAKLEKK